MNRSENADTRYFIEIDLATLELLRCGFDQKQNLQKGQQTREGIHRLFVSKGQYHKFVERCHVELAAILDS